MSTWSMNPKVGAALALMGGAALQAAACGSSSAGSTPLPVPGDASYSLPPVGDDSGDVFPDSDTPVLANLRVVNASPDAPPFDVCLAPHGTSTFQGPLLAQLVASLGSDGDGGAVAVGLSFSQVSAYLALAPGRYDVRLVLAGATSCDPDTALESPVDGLEASADDGGGPGVGAEASVADGGGPDTSGAASDAAGAGDDGAADASPNGPGSDGGSGGSPDAGGIVADGAASDAGDAGGVSVPALPVFVDLPALQANAFATLLVAGDLTPAGSDAPIGATLLADDDELPGGAASLRAIDAVPSAPALDFGLGAGAAWMPMLTDVAFGKASSMAAPGEGAVDTNGYAPIPTFAGQAMSAVVASSDAGADVATAGAVDVALGAITTVLAIGGKTGDSANPPALLICVDNQPTGGLLSDCSVGP